MERFHPRRWPLWLWTLLTVVAHYLRVDYTVGAFTFAPAVALLAGSFGGRRKGALSQAAAVVALAALEAVLPSPASAADWGFRAGWIAAAWVAGTVATADRHGAQPAPWVRRSVWSAALLTALAVIYSRSHFGTGPVGTYFSLTLLMAVLIAGFYARRIVPQPARVLAFAYAMLPYWACGLGATWLLALYLPGAAGIPAPASTRAVLFHGFLTHLPGDLIGIVVVAYLVAAATGDGDAEEAHGNEPFPAGATARSRRSRRLTLR